MKNRLTQDFIVVEGNIGAGKTTFCKMLERDRGCRLILEQFTDNPFLPFFYEHPERYAFPVELFFMTERHKQLQEMLAQGDLFEASIVADYYFIKTLLFARNNLNAEEFRLFRRLFNVLNATFRKPDLLIYLHRPVDDLLNNIKNRGRNIEKNISAAYLLEIQQAYFDYFKMIEDIPVVIVNIEKAKFWENDKEYKALTHIIQEEHHKGITHLSLKDYL